MVRLIYRTGLADRVVWLVELTEPKPEKPPLDHEINIPVWCCVLIFFTGKDMSHRVTSGSRCRNVTDFFYSNYQLRSSANATRCYVKVAHFLWICGTPIQARIQNNLFCLNFNVFLRLGTNVISEGRVGVKNTTADLVNHKKRSGKTSSKHKRRETVLRGRRFQSL